MGSAPPGPRSHDRQRLGVAPAPPPGLRPSRLRARPPDPIAGCIWKMPAPKSGMPGQAEFTLPRDSPGLPAARIGEQAPRRVQGSSSSPGGCPRCGPAGTGRSHPPRALAPLRQSPASGQEQFRVPAVSLDLINCNGYDRRGATFTEGTFQMVQAKAVPMPLSGSSPPVPRRRLRDQLVPGQPLPLFGGFPPLFLRRPVEGTPGDLLRAGAAQTPTAPGTGRGRGRRVPPPGPTRCPRPHRLTDQ